jgi:hypothetical protein
MALPYWGDGQPLIRLRNLTTFGLDYWSDGSPVSLLDNRVVWNKLAFLDNVLAKSLFDAQTVVVAVSDNTPVAVVLAEQRILGRQGGNIAALTAGEVLAILGDWLVNQVF